MDRGGIPTEGRGIRRTTLHVRGVHLIIAVRAEVRPEVVHADEQHVRRHVMVDRFRRATIPASPNMIAAIKNTSTFHFLRPLVCFMMMINYTHRPL